jgi:hypothetical protein
MALAYTVRDLMLRRWVSIAAACTTLRARTVCYLWAEYSATRTEIARAKSRELAVMCCLFRNDR